MITPVFHNGLTTERWNQLSILDQLGNIGSEVGRTLKSKANGNIQRMDAALNRAMELFDLTVADPKNRTRLKEVCRAREIFCRLYFDEEAFGYTPEALEHYFNTLAIAARMHRK